MNDANSFSSAEEAWTFARQLLDKGYDFSIYQGQKKFYVSIIFSPAASADRR